ncbi:MAG: glycosyltransferase [Isosphaeraceae bacterium]
MSGAAHALLIAYGVIVATWIVRHIVITITRRRLDILSLGSPRYRADDPPPVTALIPARDEQDSLPACLATVRTQTYPNLEIVVVDDRSVDGTAAIVERAAREDPRVRLVTIDDLPGGWTGKAHALHVAARGARGRWLWFLDADTQHHPDSLSIMMEYARAHDAGMVSLLPQSRCESFWEKVLQPLEGIVLMRSYPLHEVNRDDAPMAFANGQYILIEKGAYDSVGGHAAVRDKFVEDIHLARLVKGRGGRIRCGVTTEISSTRMYTSLPTLVRGWSRILYDALDRDPMRLAWKIVEPIIFSQSGDFALVIVLALFASGRGGPFAAWLLGLSLVHQILKQTVLIRMYAWSTPGTAIYALFYPLAGWVSAGISLKAIAMCLTGKVTWRGTSYGPAAADPRPSA